jgi:hypothetical protein
MDIRTGTGEGRSNSHIVTRRVPTRDGELDLSFKELVPGRLLVNVESVGSIKPGSILSRNKEMGMFLCYEDGLYDAIRGIARHMGDSYEDERTEIRVWLETLAWAFSVFVDPGLLSEAEAASVRRRMQAIYDAHPHFRVKQKREAREKTGAAAQLHDTRGRRNPMAKLPRIWSAEHRLGRRVPTTRVIMKHIDPRGIALLQVREKLGDMRRQFEHVLRSAMRWQSEPHKMNKSRRDYYAEQLRGIIVALRDVSVAPDGRRSFAHDADDLQAGVVALEDGRIADAFGRMDRVLRSLQTLHGREYMQDALTVASTLHHRGLSLDAKDRRTCLRALAEAEAIVNKPGLSDADFERPALPRMRAHLADAIQRLQDGLTDPKPLYDDLQGGVAGI